ncbi:MAG: KdsC family phosphatase [Longimicrobiaceae bacterium]
MNISPEIAGQIRLLVLDVDGVMTDGGVYLGATGGGEAVELKRFEITDGLGVYLLRQAGVECAVVTGRESAAVRARAGELGISECHQDAGARKLPLVEGVMGRLGLEWSGVACLADDLADLPVLARVGLPAAVANAVPEVRARALWLGQKRGGEGAVREFAEALLKARGCWVTTVDAYLRSREQA